MIFELNDGRAVIFEPTTDLICSGCRKPVNIYTTLKKKEGEDWRDVANFMFEFHSSPKPDGLAQGQYFYLHKGCARLEDYLIKHGVKLFWGFHPMGWVLGTDRIVYKYIGDLPKYLRKHMPPGVYDRLYAQWLPAIQALKARPRMVTTPVPRLVRPRVKPVPQDRPGYVYLLLVEGTNRVKIGRSQYKVVRIDYLKTASPFPLVLLRMIPSADHVWLETSLHRRYDQYKVYNEWYALPPAVLEALLMEEFL